LEELARRCPVSSEALLNVKGIGPAKLEQYGEALLALLTRHNSGGAEQPSAPTPAQPSHYWTWRVLSAGFSPEECQTIRQLPPEVIQDHLARAAEAGLPVQPEWLTHARHDS
ncbi:MAG: HRDC domain-containing protein, partial [Planctomycetota bacterium]